MKVKLNLPAAGFLFLAAVMTGCLNPVSFDTFPTADGTLPATDGTLPATDTTLPEADDTALPGAWSLLDDEPFILTVLVGDGPAGSRSIAGPDYSQIAGGKGALNYVEIIVLKGKEKEVVAVTRYWYPGSGPAIVWVREISLTEEYTFLALMGHWQRDYTAETVVGENKYMDNVPPTLFGI
jgi:hypothetical protein